MTLAPLIFEGVVAVLLLVAAVLCWRVDSRLRALKTGQDGVRQSIVELNDATERARASLAALQRAGDETGSRLDRQVAEGRRLADELQLMVDRADRQADSAVDRSARRPARRRASELFPDGAGSPVINSLKDVR